MPKRRMTFAYPTRKRARRAVRRAPTRALGRFRFRRRRRQYIPRTITPDSKMCRLRYCLTQDMNPGSGATSNFIVRANDIYAPTSGTGAHQPMGFEEIMGLYERFCVVGSKINVAFIQIDAGSSPSVDQAGIVGIGLRNNTDQESVQDNTAYQTKEGILERNRTRWKYLSYVQNGAPIKQVTMKFGAKRFFHVPTINANAGNLNDEGSLWGTSSASPTTLAYYKLFAAPFNDADDLKFKVRITVDYTAVFQGRKLLSQSGY